MDSTRNACKIEPKGSCEERDRRSRMTGRECMSHVPECMADDERHIILGTTDIDAETREAMARAETLAETLAHVEAAREKQASLLSIMSHEIRTPINTIIGICALAFKKDDVTPQTREHLLKIDESARSLLRLVNEVLDMGRIEGGRMVLAAEPFTLSSLVEDLADAVSPLCQERGIRLSCHVDADAQGTYVGDEARLEEALSSMLSYAALAAEAGGTLTCTVGRSGQLEQAGDQRVLVFAMEGTGAVIDDGSLDTIFESLSDTAGAAVPGGRGGLGMAIARRIVELMGGSAHVGAKEHGGLRFDVTVPLILAPLEGRGPAAAIDVSSLRVLVVDDNAVELEHAVAVLGEAGVKAEAATSGEEALSMMEEAHTALRPYDLVLMDWSMPGMNGLQASMEIRARYGDESTVVAMTSYSWDDIQREAQDAGVSAHLAKPLSTAHTVGQLERIALRNERLCSGERRRRAWLGARSFWPRTWRSTPTS